MNIFASIANSSLLQKGARLFVLLYVISSVFGPISHLAPEAFAQVVESTEGIVTEVVEVVTEMTSQAEQSDTSSISSVSAITVDISANGSDGPVRLSNGEALEVSWISSNAISCEITSPYTSGVTTMGSEFFAITHPSYPGEGMSTSFSITCNDGMGNTASDSVSISGPLPISTPTSPATLDISSNGAQGPVYVSQSQTFTLDWVSANVTACTLSIQGVRDIGGVALNGGTESISSAHPYFPPAGGQHEFVLTCTSAQDGSFISDSVTVVRAPNPIPNAPLVSGVAGSQCGGFVSLSWNAVVDATSYKVFRNGDIIGTVVAQSFEDIVSPSSSHVYTVIATGQYGDSPLSYEVPVTASPVCAPTVSTVDITANGSQGPVNLSSGQSFTVDWISANVTACVVNLNDGRTLNSTALNGTSGVIGITHPMYPNEGESITFTITCDGVSGSPVSDSVTVTRSGISPDAPVLSATTGSQCGGFVSLSWTEAPNTLFYEVFRGGNSIATTTALSFTEGNLSRGASYTYTVRAHNGFGISAFSNEGTAVASSSCAPVSVTVDITANGSQGPVNLSENQSFTLDWISSNAITCNLVIAGGQDLGSVEPNDGSGIIAVGDNRYPSEATSRTFVITCAGSQGQTVTDSVVVTRPIVNKVPEAPVLSANTSSQCGGNVSITWNAVSGATSYKLYRNGNVISTLTATSYQDTGLTPREGYEYSVVALNDFGASAFSNKKTVLSSNECPVAPVVFLNANPGTINEGETSKLTWSSQNATSCSASWTDSQNTGGNQTVKPSTTTTYEIVCTGPGGSANATAKVTVIQTPFCPVPVIESDLSAQGTIGKPFSYTIDATAQGTTSPITYTTSDLPKGLTLSGGVISGTPEKSGTFSVTITATNVCGSDSDTLVITIKKGSVTPSITVDLTAQPLEIYQGSSTTLAWISGNTISCSAPWTSDTSTSGSLVVSPATTTTYSITCTDGVRSASDTVTVRVLPLPQCELPVFVSANSVALSLGGSLDYAVQTASSTGTTYEVVGDLPSWITFAGNTLSGVASQAGTYTVVLKATNTCGASNLTLAITVSGGGGGGNPISVELVAQPSVISLGASSTLSWISGNTISCSAPWTSDTSTSGSLVVSPATTTTYSITCTDGVRSASAEATITVTTGGGQCEVPNITSALSANGKVGSAFSYTLTASTGTSTTTYSIATSTLPEGLSFADGVISGTPSTAGTYTVQVQATNSCGTDTENLVITIDKESTPPGGGGGGGGGGKRGGFSVSTGEVLGVTECNYLRDYLRIDWVNDTVEVIKLQVFLRELEGFKNLPVTGVFDQATFDAVAIFQEKYESDILTPWGHTKYTGFVYILTKKKVNEIVCQREFPLTTDQQTEIREFRAFLTALSAQGIAVDGSSSISQGHNGQNVLENQPISSVKPDILNEYGEELLGDKGQEGEIGEEGAFTTNENLRAIAAAIFAGPQGWKESWNSVLYYFIILCVLYILSTARVHSVHQKYSLTPESMRIRKLFWFIVGLTIALIISFVSGLYTIILPLFVTLCILAAFLGFSVFTKKKQASGVVEEVIQLGEPSSKV